MKRRPHSPQAFSLVELLVVIAIIGIIASFAVPALNNLLKGSRLAEASNILNDQIVLSRQNAVSKNKVIEVRFYRFADPEMAENVTAPTDWQYRAIQTFEIAESGVPVPLGEYKRLPDSIIMNSNSKLSSIFPAALASLQDPNASLDPKLPRGVDHNYQYAIFRLYPDGSTNLAPTGSWFITVHALADKPPTPETPPPNFFTLQVDPVSGSTKSFRPGI